MPITWLFGISIVLMLVIYGGCSIIHSPTGNESVKFLASVIMVLFVGILIILGFYLSTGIPVVVK